MKTPKPIKSIQPGMRYWTAIVRVEEKMHPQNAQGNLGKRYQKMILIDDEVTYI